MTTEEFDNLIMTDVSEFILMKNNTLSHIFSFLSFTFSMSLIGLLIHLLINSQVVFLSIFAGGVIISLIGGVLINTLDKYLAQRQLNAKIEKLLHQKEA